MSSGESTDLLLEADRVIQQALSEDVQDGDHSSLACIPAEKLGSAKLLVKDDGVLAGMLVAKRTLHAVDPNIAFFPELTDGDLVKEGQIAFRARGSARNLLTAERILLNLMQRLSGVATMTAAFVKELEGTGTRVLDTRKTTPGLRILEKWAVTLGGGTNHRFGLYDMIMLKDNHIDHAGGIENAILTTQEYLTANKLQLKVEIEVRNLAELEQVLTIGRVDRIMLDNFNYGDLRSAVQHIGGRFETEASGGIVLETARNYAECGVDFISVGALTHSVKSLDLSLKTVLE